MRFNCFVLLLCCFFTLQTHSESDPKQIEGQATYDEFCVICHQGGVAGAPRFENEKDWKPRLTGKTIDDLVESATKGLNIMPEKGTCVECSAEDLKAAIQYMLPKP